jgi:hypothetical protein
MSRFRPISLCRAAVALGDAAFKVPGGGLNRPSQQFDEVFQREC